jgi:hypothetical protein
MATTAAFPVLVCSLGVTRAAAAVMVGGVLVTVRMFVSRPTTAPAGRRHGLVEDDRLVHVLLR